MGAGRHFNTLHGSGTTTILIPIGFHDSTRLSNVDLLTIEQGQQGSTELTVISPARVLLLRTRGHSHLGPTRSEVTWTLFFLRPSFGLAGLWLGRSQPKPYQEKGGKPRPFRHTLYLVRVCGWYGSQVVDSCRFVSFSSGTLNWVPQ